MAGEHVRITSVLGFTGNRVLFIAGQTGSLELYRSDASGRAQRVGRRGGGPGEYLAPVGLHPYDDSTALLVDSRLMRTAQITATGRMIATALIGSSPEAPPWIPTQADGSHRLLSLKSFGGLQAAMLPILRWSPATRRVDTAATLAYSPVVISNPRKTLTGDLVVDVVSPPYMKQDKWTVLRDGRVVIAHADPYAIEVAENGGRKSLTPVLPFTAIPVGGRERDSLETSGVEARLIPRTKAPFPSEGVMLASVSGFTWLEVSLAQDDSFPKYDVFSEDGKRSYRAVLPPGARVAGFGPEGVFIVRRNRDDDTETLVYHALPAMARRPR